MKKILPGFLLLFFATTASADDVCALARTIAAEGAKTFVQNQAEGLKLFIKARELCPGQPQNSYNLGVAYYRYGRLAEARTFLQEAVQADNVNPVWLSNLAQVLLEQRDGGTEALRLAERAAKAAVDNPAIQETLARVRFAAGKELAALTGLRELLFEQRVQATYTDLLDRYLAAQLVHIKDNRAEQGLVALAALDFEPKALRLRAQALARLDRGEEALIAIDAAQRKFPADAEMRPAAEEITNQVAGTLYREFQSGQAAPAVTRARRLSEQYPQAVVLRQAYDKLFEAMLADAKTIAVPAAGAKMPIVGTGGGRAEQLLAGLGGGGATTSGSEIDLLVDVDQNIPQGAAAGKYDVAVVIGNRTYGAGGTPNVDYALRDARTMREYLVKALGFDAGMIIYEEDAGYAKFNEIFGNDRDHRGRLFNYIRKNESRVFVYYTGHGAPDPDTGDAYFVPVDADPQFLKTSGYRLQTFYENLAKLPAAEVTVVLDSCFSGNSAKGLLLKGVSSITMKPKEVPAPVMATVFTSAMDDQVSAWYPEKRHSLFTYYFLKGLQGAADANRDRKITVAEMEKYIGDEVPYMAQKLRGTQQKPLVSGRRDQVLAVLK